MITWGSWFWPWWLGALIASGLAAEAYALVSRGTDSTRPNWVWHQLGAHFLVFGVWLVMVVWLTWHLFFHWFALWPRRFCWICSAAKAVRPWVTTAPGGM